MKKLTMSIFSIIAITICFTLISSVGSARNTNISIYNDTDTKTQIFYYYNDYLQETTSVLPGETLRLSGSLNFFEWWDSDEGEDMKRNKQVTVPGHPMVKVQSGQNLDVSTLTAAPGRPVVPGNHGIIMNDTQQTQTFTWHFKNADLSQEHWEYTLKPGQSWCLPHQKQDDWYSRTSLVSVSGHKAIVLQSGATVAITDLLALPTTHSSPASPYEELPGAREQHAYRLAQNP